MRKILSMILVLALSLSVASVPAVAVSKESQSGQIDFNSVGTVEEMFPTTFEYSTSYVDDFGAEGYIRFSTIDGRTYVEVYVDGILTQRAVSSPAEDIVAWIEYPGESAKVSLASEPVLQSLNYSDVVSDVVSMDSINQSDDTVSTLAFSTEGWSYVLRVPSNASIVGSKPCTVYSRNYDDEPDLHRYNGKQIKLGAGTAVGAVVSVVASFITGQVTVGTIVMALGSSIVADAITNAITGTVCFSTQKIRYAPVINGTNIFPDAYITKRWVIIYDAVAKKESFKLDNPSYAYNKGEDVYRIAYNAQMAEVTG